MRPVLLPSSAFLSHPFFLEPWTILARRFLLNLKVESFNPDDMYQGAFVLDPAEGWTTLRLPLSDFMLTARGRHLESQRQLDGEILLQSVGLLALADDERSDFCLDVASVTALPHEVG